MRDELPDLFFTGSKERAGNKTDSGNGKLKGLIRENFKAMLDEYYQAMGWDKMPGQEKPGYAVSRACDDGLEHLIKSTP